MGSGIPPVLIQTEMLICSENEEDFDKVALGIQLAPKNLRCSLRDKSKITYPNFTNQPNKLVDKPPGISQKMYSASMGIRAVF